MVEPAHGPAEVTQLLRRLRGGDEAAGEPLFEAVHRELHALARQLMRGERVEHTLQPTALISEAWLRLLGQPAQATLGENRAHFLRTAARAMRRVLVDHARARQADKRGPAERRVELDPDQIDAAWHDPTELLAVEEALHQLELRDAEAARVVELRYFAGLTSAETAEVLGWSVRQVEGSWVFARGWLRRELERRSADG
jgi:RNA polymerase sigma-70 factor, ECF subfamily